MSNSCDPMDCSLPGSSVHVNYVSVKARVFPGDSDGEESAAMQETHVHSPGEGNGNPLQYFCLENPMDRGAWWAPVGSRRAGHD